MFKQLEISFLFYFGDIKDYFHTVCKKGNEYFDCELLLINSYSVFPVLHMIFVCKI